MHDKTAAFETDYEFLVARADRPASRRYEAFGKRVLDLCVVVLAAPVVLTVLAIVWLVGRFNGGKVFFSQERIGQGGKTFRCYKVRTMVKDADRVLAELIESDASVAAEWSKFQKLRNDPRITRWGNFLRATSIDELPQLLNVLRGEMSIVGPRPFMSSQMDLYRAGGGGRYFAMRPGLTGEWQVIGRGSTSFVDRVRFDNRYYDRVSLLHDLRLIAGTFGALLRRTGH